MNQEVIKVFTILNADYPSDTMMSHFSDYFNSDKKIASPFDLYHADRNKIMHCSSSGSFEHVIKSCIIFTQDPQPTTMTHPPTHADETISRFHLLRLTCSKRIISLQWPESFLRKIVLRILTVKEDTLKKTYN